MPDIDALLTRYFVNVGDVVQAGEKPTDPDKAITAATRPFTTPGSRVTHLIDGSNYFGALKTEVAALLAGGTERFFYTCSWYLGTSQIPNLVPIAEGAFTSAWGANARMALGNTPPFELRDGGSGPFHPFKDDIAQMSGAGVDVRILVWASPFLVNFEAVASKAIQYWAVNVHSLQSVLDLRTLPGMSAKVALNTMAHTLGAMHIKMVVCGDSAGFRAYVGGLDLVQNRHARPVHGPNAWHDVGLKLEGNGANALFHYFALLWNEQIQRSPKTFKAFGHEIASHSEEAALIDLRDTPPVGGGQHVQVLRTLPAMNFSFFATERVDRGCFTRLVSGFRQSQISFAKEGIFEFRAAQRKAISGAQRYIYIEDQMFWNLEVADWINERLKALAGLKVIMIYRGDPLDPPSLFLPAFMDHLIKDIPASEERVVFGLATYTTHGKVTIIDDLWAAVGSSNCMRRSFYTDGEASVSVVDEAEPSFAGLLRKDLWGDHCRKEPGPACDPLLNLDQALGIWRASWGAPPAGFALSPEITLMTIPFVFSDNPGPTEMKTPNPFTETDRDQQDADSRLEY